MNTQILRSFRLMTLALLFVGLTVGGCANLSKTEKGAAAGAGAGGIIGGVIGAATGNTAKGAIIGAVVGGTAGAIIGQQMDKQAKELEEELADAEVERVGEGIQVTFESGILFGFDSSELQPVARQNLRNLAESLQNYDNTDILVVGHTDATGSDDYNYRLSERRANAAADYLLFLGVDRNRLTTVGKGESDPIASNDTEEGRTQNRRVEIIITANEQFQREAEAQAN